MLVLAVGSQARECRADKAVLGDGSEIAPASAQPYQPGLVPPNGSLRYCIHYREVDPDFLYFLQRARINFLHWHGPFYGYTGMPERAQLEGLKASARETIEQVHEAGAACILYIGPCFSYGDRDQRTILFDFYDHRWQDYEDYFGSKPGDLLDMAQRDTQGTPQPYEYGGQKGYHLCVNSPGVRQYTQGLIRMICEAGGDGSFYDGPYVTGGSCYCRWCRERFRQWLRRTYSRAELRTHFGVSDPGGVEPPTSAKEPLYLPWRQFAAWSLEDFLRDTKSYARSLNPHYAMTANFCMWDGEPFGPLRGSAENMELWSRVLDVVFDEAKYGAGPHTSQGVKLSNATDYRYLLAAAHGKPVALLKTAPEGDTPEAPATLTRLAIAEGAAQGATWQFNYLKPPATQAAYEYNQFLAQRSEVMTRARPWAPVAVWTSLQQGYLDLPTSPMGISRFLADHHVPHNLVIDEDVEQGRLAPYEVLVVPEVQMMSERQLALLRTFVAQGRGLVLMGECGTLDEWGERRKSLPFLRATPTEPRRQSAGKGRLAYLPAVTLPASPNLGLSREAESRLVPLLSLLEWASGRGPAAAVEAGANVEIVTAFDGRDTLLVHLVNYAVDLGGHVEAETNVPVKVRLPRGTAVQSAALWSPDGGVRKQNLRFDTVTPGPDAYVSLVVPRLEIYDQIELRLKHTQRTRSDLPRLDLQVEGEAAPGGRVTLNLALTPPGQAQWQVAGPPGWLLETTSRAKGHATCLVCVPESEGFARRRLHVSARLGGGTVLSDDVWLRVTAPLELRLRVPPHADTHSGRTKVEALLHSRFSQPVTARVDFVSPAGWPMEPSSLEAAVAPAAVTTMAAWLRTPQDVKPGTYEVQAQATWGPDRSRTASASLSVLDHFQALLCPRLTVAPKIDGRLDDTCWQGVPGAADFQRNDGQGQAREQTRAWLAYDDKNLYVALECQESEPQTLISLVDQDGGEVWRDDSVEVFLDRNHDHQSYTQYVANVAGYKSGIDRGSGLPTAGWQVATGRTAKGWVVEMALPFNGAAPGPGEMWGLNLCRTRPARPQAEPEYSSWAYTGGGFHNPEKFGHVVFGSGDRS
jgi:hypothetical protein